MDYRYNYEYDYPIRNSGENVVEAIVAIYLIILAMVVIFALVGYIFHSIGLYTIGKRMGREYPWLAFIPFARDYFQGELAGEITLKNKKIKNPGVWNLLIPIISSVLIGIFMALIMLVAGLGAAVQAVGGSGLEVTAILGILMYTVLLVAVVALSAARMALTVLIDKQILERFTTGNMPTVHAVLSVALPLYEAFCFFVMRNRDFNPGMEPKLTPPPAPIPPVYPGGPVPPVNPAAPAASENPETMYGADMSVPPVKPAEPEQPDSVTRPAEQEETKAVIQLAGPEGAEPVIQPAGPEDAEPVIQPERREEPDTPMAWEENEL